jgi:hypothetical protein
LLRDEYSKRAIENCLLNWGELEEAMQESLVIVRCDLEMAIDRLSKTQREAVYTVFLEGEGAFLCRAVEPAEWGQVISRLHEILNHEGVVAWWERG